MGVKLVDREPHFVGSGGEGITRDGQPVPRREGIGLSFDCPCGCGEKGFCYFRNPLDGGPSIAENHPSWEREGETFETLTLSPSIQRMSGCRWHGFLRNGEFVNA